MEYLTIKPILGLKNDVSPNSVFCFVKEFAHTVDHMNIDLSRINGSSSSSYGLKQWDNETDSVSEATEETMPVCLGLYELYDGSKRTHIHCAGGAFFIYDNAKTLQNMSKDININLSISNPYVFTTFGNYVIFSDGENELYKWKYGNTAISLLIDKEGATRYGFKYVTHLANRIMGIHETGTQTPGPGLSIRYSDILPPVGTGGFEFPTVNQFYKPEGDALITGVAKLGYNSLFLFSDTDITRVDYYTGGEIPFTAARVLKEYGSVNHYSIVSDGIYLYFFDETRGFCRFDGNRDIQVISGNIENTIADMGRDTYPLLHGIHLPFSNDIAWAVSIGKSSVPNHLLYYNTKTQQWRKEDKKARAMSFWQSSTTGTWKSYVEDRDKEIVVSKPDIGLTWADLGLNQPWFIFDPYISYLVLGYDGDHVHYVSKEVDADSWVVYPIFPLGDKNRKRILEIRPVIDECGTGKMDFYLRGDKYSGKLLNLPWKYVGSLELPGKDNVPHIIRCSESAKYLQLKIECNTKISISDITIAYTIGGRNY